MKIKSYRVLFNIFSYLSDKTGGASFFVKYKLMLGTLIIGLTGTATNAKAQQDKTPVSGKDTLQVQVTCYKPTAPKGRLQNSTRIIKGQVKDQYGELLPGAIITLKDDRTKGVVTDINGKFTLEAKPEDILLFSYIGFRSIEMPVSKMKNDFPEIIMEEDNSQISCYIVVVGHTYKKPPKIKNLPYEETEGQPVPPVGNRDDFQQWMEENIKYNERMLNEKTEGQLLISFIVDKKGNIIHPRVVSKLSPEADAEALRVLSASQKWQPGFFNGKAIETTVTIPVQFVLPEKKSNSD